MVEPVRKIGDEMAEHDLGGWNNSVRVEVVIGTIVVVVGEFIHNANVKGELITVYKVV